MLRCSTKKAPARRAILDRRVCCQVACSSHQVAVSSGTAGRKRDLTTSAKKEVSKVINPSFTQAAFRLPLHLILALAVEKIRRRHKSRDELVADILMVRYLGEAQVRPAIRARSCSARKRFF